jgi:hypothetical protein
VAEDGGENELAVMSGIGWLVWRMRWLVLNSLFYQVCVGKGTGRDDNPAHLIRSALRAGIMLHTCNTSCLGGRDDRKISSLRPAQAKRY